MQFKNFTTLLSPLLNVLSAETAVKSSFQNRKWTYTITIKGGSKVIFSSFHGVDQVGGVCQVGVRVVAPKVLLGDTVDC